MFHRRWWWQPWPSCPYPPAKASIKHKKWPHTPPTQSSSSIPISFPYFPLYLAKLPRIASSSAWAASSNSVNNSGCFKSRLCFILKPPDSPNFLRWSASLSCACIWALSSCIFLQLSAYWRLWGWLCMRVADPVLDIPHYLYDGGEHRHPYQDIHRR